ARGRRRRAGAEPGGRHPPDGGRAGDRRADGVALPGAGVAGGGKGTGASSEADRPRQERDARDTLRMPQDYVCAPVTTSPSRTIGSPPGPSAAYAIRVPRTADRPAA